jgi:transposase
MTTKRKEHPPAFKAKVVLEVLREDKTLAEIASRHRIHPNLLSKWRKLALENLPALFEGGRSVQKKDSDTEALLAQLYQQIGQMKVELDWLKKKSGLIEWHETPAR